MKNSSAIREKEREMSNEIVVCFLVFILIPFCACTLGLFLVGIMNHLGKTP